MGNQMSVRWEQIMGAITVDDKKLAHAIQSWVAQHNRRDVGRSPGRHDMYFERSEGGLKVTDHTTFYANDDGVGTRTVATFNGATVFEQAGLVINICVPGDWTKIVLASA
jgi:hypothetical protein